MSSDASDTSASQIYDSLPYYDNDLEQYPILKDKVAQELAKETKAQQGLHPRVPPPIELFTVCTRNSVTASVPLIVQGILEQPIAASRTRTNGS